MNPNVLRQWMQFYGKQGLGSPRHADAGDGRFVPVRDDNRNAAAMMFAERMGAGGPGEEQRPEFFADQQPFNALAAYREPQMSQGPMMPERRRNTNVLRSMRMGG